jgi:hypothetical protein
MSERLYRTQILLEPDQHRALEELARKKARSLSDIVREILREYLTKHQEEEGIHQELEALRRLREIREESSQRYGVYQGDIIEEVRNERDEDLERIWRGQD